MALFGARRYTRRTNTVAAHLTLPLLRAAADPAPHARFFDLAESMQRGVVSRDQKTRTGTM